MTLWMGSIPFSGVMGSTIGSLLASIAADNKQLGIEDWLNWRYCMLFPSLAFVMLASVWYTQKNKVLDT